MPSEERPESKSSLLSKALESRTRRIVLLTFMKSPNREFTLAELSRETKSSTGQMIGALRGYGSQYKPELSLLSLQLCTEIVLKGSRGRLRKVYRLNKLPQGTIEQIEYILARYSQMGEH